MFAGYIERQSEKEAKEGRAAVSAGEFAGKIGPINSDKSHPIVMAGRGANAARRMDVQVQAGQDIVEQSES